jgi:hypothetical protein
VRVQNPATKRWDATGTIIEAHNAVSRTFKVDINGKMMIRNKLFLHPVPNEAEATTEKGQEEDAAAARRQEKEGDADAEGERAGANPASAAPPGRAGGDILGEPNFPPISPFQLSHADRRG